MDGIVDPEMLNLRTDILTRWKWNQEDGV